MNLQAPKAKSPPLTESQRRALVSLLADDDPGIFAAVRERILAEGTPARDWLGDLRLSNDPVLRRHGRELLEVIERRSADDEFLLFCLRSAEECDLERAVWLLARTQYPEVNPAAYEALLDSFAGELLDRIDFGAPPPQILAEINNYLYAELGFRGDETNYYDPRNSYLNQVIDRRQGNPISLCLVYLFVARRLRLPVSGIGMPGHFICRFQSSTGELYIDAFNRGRLLSKADCIRYLQESGRETSDQLLAPATPRRILMRVCSNLHQIYLNLEQVNEMNRLQRYLVALAKQPLLASDASES